MRRKRLLLLFEPGRAGAAAVDYAGDLAAEGATLTVIGLAPRASGPRCGPSAHAYDSAVADAVVNDLRRVRQRLSQLSADIAYEFLVEDRDSMA